MAGANEVFGNLFTVSRCLFRVKGREVELLPDQKDYGISRLRRGTCPRSSLERVLGSKLVTRVRARVAGFAERRTLGLGSSGTLSAPRFWELPVELPGGQGKCSWQLSPGLNRISILRRCLRCAPTSNRDTPSAPQRQYQSPVPA